MKFCLNYDQGLIKKVKNFVVKNLLIFFNKSRAVYD